MKKINSLLRVFLSKAASCAVLTALLLAAGAPLFAQTAEVRNAGVYYRPSTTTNGMYCDWSAEGLDELVDSEKGYNRSFVTSPAPDGNANQTDPWVSSALIEYDQPYPSTTPNANNYPNHCLSLCMQVVCTNKPMAQSTYSISFPLQQIKFDIVKYYNGKNIENPDETPAIRTISLYPNLEEAKCGSYVCPGGPAGEYTCSAPKYELRNGTCYILGTDDEAPGECSSKLSTAEGGNCENHSCNYIIFNNDGTPTNQPITFCAAWDGSYEIGGEFGKSNGDYAFRATVATDTPGDNIITDKIEFNSTIAYPGMNQIPIQVDVTNVHSVRSTPTVVGDITAVSAQPYTFAYRLSKDSDVRVAIFDASNSDDIDYGATNNIDNLAATSLVRTLVDWQPRMGEGMKGTESDTQIIEFDSWDGRNDSGMLLPAGNYVAAIQAKAQDEWPGVDFSRAVTRQVSLDPLKLTDITSTGLNKKSTAYASINYVPTEPSTVYLQIYTPGTTFTGASTPTQVLTDSSTPTGTGPTAQGGSLVYSASEQRSGRMNFTSKWDGLCGMEEGCTRTYAKGEEMSNGVACNQNTCTETFAYGAPMPDGNYVYVLWAEIPYNGSYVNAVGGNGTPAFTAQGTCAAGQNGKCYTGVKTLNYSIGQLPVERGLVDITIQPVSYSTVGSSPTAYGLDPFIFKYAIARDATVIARVENAAGVPVKHLTPEEGITQVSQQLNTLSWDGRDDQGRIVTPGTYMFTVQTKDAMFPSVTNKASAVFPVDMYRVVDVSTTDVYGDSEAKATISYMLSKAMNVQINIYNKDVVIPAYNDTTGDYNDYTVISTQVATGYTNDLASVNVYEQGQTDIFATLTAVAVGTVVKLQPGTGNPYTRDTITAAENPNYVEGSAVAGEEQYIVTLKRESVNITTNTTTTWPPRICDKTTDAKLFCPADATWTDGTGGAAGTCSAASVDYVVPSRVTSANACIYVNDTTFTNYPTTAAQAASGAVDVRLQPVKTFDRSATKAGEGMPITEEWDALYFYNPTPSTERHTQEEIDDCTGATDLKQCPYEMVPDGQYPFFISARSDEAFNRYYANGCGQRPADKISAGCSVQNGGRSSTAGLPVRHGKTGQQNQRHPRAGVLLGRLGGGVSECAAVV